MKKAPRKAKSRPDDEMRAEYRLDYAKARENRFGGRVPKNAVAVVLDPELKMSALTTEVPAFRVDQPRAVA